MSRKRLGRGLDALLATPAEPAEPAKGELDEIPLGQIVRSRYQPRQDFDEELLAELAASIKAQGLMQPIVVRARPLGGYELIAGERRWRAAELAGLERIPAVIKDVGDEQASAMALIENIQREDLNPLEEAVALERLRKEFELTQQEVADAVGKSRAAVANLMRLLNLSTAVQNLLRNGDLEMGHARALLSLDADDQERLAGQVVEHQLSVRETEALVKRHQNPLPKHKPAPRPKDADTQALERDLADKVGAPVTIRRTPKGGGEMVIRFNDLDELDGILRHIR